MADWDGPTFESETTRALLKQEIVRLQAEVEELRKLVARWEKRAEAAKHAHDGTSHYAHHDPKGTAGVNCPACADRLVVTSWSPACADRLVVSKELRSIISEARTLRERGLLDE
jgi:phage shock protein A